MTLCAAVQLTSGANVQNNLEVIEKLIIQAVKAGAKLIALPENFALMGEHEMDKVNVREPDGNGMIQDFLARTARENQVWLVAGTVPMQARHDRKVRAACLIYNALGERVARYDKVHLFDVDLPEHNERYRESDSIEPGEAPLVIDTPVGRLGVAICYDLRFPEFFRKMQQQQLDVVVVPAAFTAKTGEAHWEVLLRARAIENLCYVIAPNQTGTHSNGRSTFGHSMIVDPWGKVLDCLAEGEGLALADVDHEHLNRIRRSFPVLMHRRIN
jgi:predicted amidohydrolase